MLVSDLLGSRPEQEAGGGNVVGFRRGEGGEKRLQEEVRGTFPLEADF